MAFPLLAIDEQSAPSAARDLIFDICPKAHAVNLVREWHSRLPNCQHGPWMYAFHGYYDDTTYVVALWNNPSTRSLPGHWVELRRLAAAPDAPRNTCSRFMGWMVRWLKENHPEHERCISYQDTNVHLGTIYKAAGWTPAQTGNERERDRSGKRRNTNRYYRWSINGRDADKSAKVRWEKPLHSKLQVVK